MKRRIFCSLNCYSPLKDTHASKLSGKLYLSLIAFLHLKLSGQECISGFGFLKGEKRDSDTCNTEKFPVLYRSLQSQFFPPKKICRNICSWAGTTSTELVIACCFLGRKEPGSAEAAVKNTIMEEENYPKCFCLSEKLY